MTPSSEAARIPRSRGLSWPVVLGVVYLVALVASHAVRRPVPRRPVPDWKLVVEVPEAGSGAREGRSVRMAYRTWGDSTAGVPVLMIHGSPGSSGVFGGFGSLMARDRFVVAPDLPGFGDSDHRIADYSVAAHAEYVLDMLDELHIDSVDVIGFSMGGGVALEMLHRQPGRVRSLTMLSAIGVQELELLGNYWLNHAVHWAQLAGAWALFEAVPHFGVIDGFPLDVPYARNFYDTDQRPLRGILQQITVPTLIVHGERDPLVPANAAREHHRLVPHSEMVMLSSDHFMVFQDPERLVRPITGFLQRVDAGTAPRRADAMPDRVAAARLPFDPSIIPPPAGVTLLVILTLIALATFISEDIACIATGLLVSQGRLGLVAGIIACYVGILVGDVIIYAAGRKLGRAWVGRAPIRWFISPAALARSADWFNRRGPIIILGSRFVPGTRTATQFVSGVLRTNFGQFLAYMAIAVAIWTPLLVGLTSWLGTKILPQFGVFQRWALPSVVITALAVWLIGALIRNLSSWSGRRRLLGALRRKLEWEFWPPWAVYAPLVPWICWLMLRHRGMTVFTAANPGIEGGGFIGESKSAILDELPPADVAAFQKIDATMPAEERYERAARFIEKNALGFPVVVKPDVGERGTGVTIARDAAGLREALDSLNCDSIIQEYVPGVELGVFYYRIPGKERGNLLSITEKRFPQATGDGERTLEQLILSDARLRKMSPLHLSRFAARLTEIPADGETVTVVEVGTHRLGALFLDGDDRRTPALERKVDEISRAFPGFFFGRYDLRAATWEDFGEGNGIKVVELNGVTSEATSIYDPKNSFFTALAVLARQWRLAFEIGAANRARGVRPASLRSLLGSLARHLL